MDTSTTPSAAPVPSPWSRRRRFLMGFTAVALVAGGGAAIAAGQPDTPEPGDAKLASAAPVPGKAAFGILGGVLHSESVVADGNGGYVTHLTQAGKIESLDADRLTVVSEDGYSKSWNRTSDTVVGGGGWSVEENDDGSFTVKQATEDLAVGDQVLVVGTLSGDEATAQRIAARPDTGKIPGGILKRLEGEFGGKADGSGGLKERLRERFEMKMPGGPGGPGADVRRFELRMPGEKAEAVPAPAPSEEATPSASAVPAEPSSIAPSGFSSLT